MSVLALYKLYLLLIPSEYTEEAFAYIELENLIYVCNAFSPIFVVELLLIL